MSVFKKKDKSHLSSMMFFDGSVDIARYDQVKYPRWDGAYPVGQKTLYVNRGFGYLAFPGRVGMWPEVTIHELQPA